MIGKTMKYLAACIGIVFLIGALAILSAKLLIILTAIILIGATLLIIASPFVILYYLMKK